MKTKIYKKKKHLESDRNDDNILMIMRPFTLMELLIVMGVIAILASMLLPALKTARDTATRIVCVGRIKQLATPWQAYMSDYDNFLPQATGTAKVSDNWICKIMSELFTPAELNTAGSNNVPVKDWAPWNRAAAKKFRVLLCPDDPPDYTKNVASSGIAQGMSYGMNYYSIGGQVYCAGMYSASSIPYKKYTQIVSWSKQVAFLEHPGSDAGTHLASINGYPVLPLGSFRHGRKTQLNVLYCDGHTETVPITRKQTVSENRLTFSNPEK